MPYFHYIILYFYTPFNFFQLISSGSKILKRIQNIKSLWPGGCFRGWPRGWATWSNPILPTRFFGERCCNRISLNLSISFLPIFFLSGLDEGHLKCNLGGFISLPKGKLIKLFHVTKGRVARISSFGPSNLIAHSIDKLKRFKSLSPASLYVYQINL